MRCCSVFLPALAGCVAAQFSSPSKASALEIGKQIDIKWNTAGLEAPIAINLVPAGGVGQTVIAQQVAVGIQNIGLLTWTPDISIAAFPSFNMVIIDSKARVVVSDEFTIQSLVQQPALVTRLIPIVTNVVAADDKGVMVTQRVTSTSQVLLPLPTEPIKLHMSGTRVVDSLVTGVNERVSKPTQDVNKDGQKEGLLPLPGIEGNEKPLGELKPLPGISGSTTTSSSAEPSQKEVRKSGGNGDAVAVAGKKNQGANKNMQGKQKQGGGNKDKDKQAKYGNSQGDKGGNKGSNKDVDRNDNNKGKTHGSEAKKPMAKRSPDILH